jgi:hypothetical protein
MSFLTERRKVPVLDDGKIDVCHTPASVVR